MADEAEKQQRYKRGRNPNSRKNLKLFVRGQSGNPEGRPKGLQERGKVFEKLLTLKTKVADPANPKTNTLEVTVYEAAALGQIMSAMKGNTQAWKEIQDTLFGKVKEEINLDANVTGEIIVNVICSDTTED